MNDDGKMTAKRLAELAMLTAVALIIFVIELLIPPFSDIPGIKPGLANIVTVYCVYRYKPLETAAVAASRAALSPCAIRASFSVLAVSASAFISS